MNRAAVLEFVAALKDAAREDSTMSVDEILARVDARMKDIHIKLNQLRLYEARRNLLDEYRSGAAERREAAARMRRRTAHALERVDAMLREATLDVQDPVPVKDTEHDGLVWFDGSEDPNDVNWVKAVFESHFKKKRRGRGESDRIPFDVRVDVLHSTS